MDDRSNRRIRYAIAVVLGVTVFAFGFILQVAATIAVWLGVDLDRITLDLLGSLAVGLHDPRSRGPTVLIANTLVLLFALTSLAIPVLLSRLFLRQWKYALATLVSSLAVVALAFGALAMRQALYLDPEGMPRWRVRESHSRLNGEFRDTLRDTNGDGMADELVIFVGVSVTDRAPLALRGMLFDGKGRMFDGGASGRILEPGERFLELKYRTEELYESADPGPFTLDTLRLIAYDEHVELFAMLADTTNVYRTRVYARQDFRYAQILQNGEVEARALDSNGNGEFDVLVIDVGVDIDYPGNYAWNGILADSDGFAEGWLVQGNEWGRLEKGTNRLRFEFPGTCIRRANAPDSLWLQGMSIGLTGESLPGAPQHSISIPTFRVPGNFPSDRFEQTGFAQFRSSRGGSYHCQ